MTQQAEEVEPEEVEPEGIDLSSMARVPMHGVLAPEGKRSGDGRGFLANSLRSRPLPYPMGWQRSSASGHDASISVAAIEKVARIDGLIHYSGHFFSTVPEADELIGIIGEMGHYGVSIDADEAQFELDEEAETVWFSDARISAASAVNIPAFAEAYIALGPHPLLDNADADEETLASIGEVEVTGERESFKRGPGWITHPKETKRIHDYWTKKGQPGYAKINWGVPGDFNRCRVLVGEKIAINSPEDTRFLNQICSQWHHDALGIWPGQEAAGETVAASEMNIVSLAASSSVPTIPFKYFADPKFTTLTAMTITEPDEDGIRRVFGHAAEWGECHVGYLSQAGMCVTPPESPTNYSYFLEGLVDTEKGPIKVGPLVCGEKHAGQFATWREAMSWYESTANTWGWVNVGRDEFGTWMSGIVRPNLDDDTLFTVKAVGQVSGDWRAIEGDEADELIGLLSVNNAGFPKLRPTAGVVDGVQISLVAAGVVPRDLTPSDPIEELADAVVERLTARQIRKQEMKALEEEMSG